MTSEREIEALATCLASDFIPGDSAESTLPSWTFSPDALQQFARRLQPARAPEKRVTEAAKAISTVRQGNANAYRMYLDDARAALSAAPAPSPTFKRSDGATQCVACGGWNLPGLPRCCDAPAPPPAEPDAGQREEPSWADYWIAQGRRDIAHDFALFEHVEAWMKARSLASAPQPTQRGGEGVGDA